MNTIPDITSKHRYMQLELKCIMGLSPRTREAC